MGCILHTPNGTRIDGGSVCSYKAGSWPYGRFGSLIAKSDRFPSIGPFVVTSDGNRCCRVGIAACQSSSFRRRCGGGRTRYRDSMRSRWQMGADLWEMSGDSVTWLQLCNRVLICVAFSMGLGYKLFLLLYINRFAFDSMKFLIHETYRCYLFSYYLSIISTIINIYGF